MEVPASITCAACAYRGRYCLNSCVLAPYFPFYPHIGCMDFMPIGNYFNAGYVEKTIATLGSPQEREAAVICFRIEANARLLDRVLGFCRRIYDLLLQIQSHEQELHNLRECLALRHQPQPTNPNYPLLIQNQQPKQQQLHQNSGSGGCGRPIITRRFQPDGGFRVNTENAMITSTANEYFLVQDQQQQLQRGSGRGNGAFASSTDILNYNHDFQAIIRDSGIPITSNDQSLPVRNQEQQQGNDHGGFESPIIIREFEPHDGSRANTEKAMIASTSSEHFLVQDQQQQLQHGGGNGNGGFANSTDILNYKHDFQTLILDNGIRSTSNDQSVPFQNQQQQILEQGNKRQRQIWKAHCS